MFRRIILVAVIVFAVHTHASSEQGVYKIALGFPFSPWDVGPLEGFNYDLLSAISSANVGMRCQTVHHLTVKGAGMFAPALFERFFYFVLCARYENSSFF